MNMQVNVQDGIYSYVDQPQMQAEVILCSVGTGGQDPLFTIRLRYPRIIHAEVETHRVMSINGVVVEVTEPNLGIMAEDDFSRNARSSRAVPVKTMLNEVRNVPFIPWHWGKNQSGMQASEECEVYLLNQQASIPEFVNRERAWLYARDVAANTAEAFMNAGYHKQIPNRLLEPFSWIDTLITSTEWDNFLWLREHEAAEPHLQDLARLVHKAIKAADFEVLEPGIWHLPYITAEDECAVSGDLLKLCKISAARCARISYKPFNGDASYARELERYESLISSDRVHASPLEHQATPDEWISDTHYGASPHWKYAKLHGNLNGYIQYRKTIPNEAKMSGVL